MRPLLALAALLALVAGVFVFWLSRGTAPSEERAVTMTDAPSAPPANAPGAAIEAPPVRETLPEPRVESPSATGEHAPVEIPEVDFDAKYKDWSLERLAGAREMLDTTVNSTLEEIYAERLQAGLFEESITGPGESFTSRAFTGPVKTWSESISDGRMRIRSVEVPVAEYPRLQAMRQELDWLNSKILTLKNPKKS